MQSKLGKEEWKEHIRKQKESLLSQKEYCIKEGLAFPTFSRWKSRLERENANKGKGFIELNAKQLNIEPVAWHYSISFPNGCSISLNQQYSEEVLKSLLALVKEL
ncbi:hypothetical protein MASR2M29_17600 [Spirochaetota bacterium]